MDQCLETLRAFSINTEPTCLKADNPLLQLPYLENPRKQNWQREKEGEAVFELGNQHPCFLLPDVSSVACSAFSGGVMPSSFYQLIFLKETLSPKLLVLRARSPLLMAFQAHSLPFLTIISQLPELSSLLAQGRDRTLLLPLEASFGRKARHSEGQGRW